MDDEEIEAKCKYLSILFYIIFIWYFINFEIEIHVTLTEKHIY